MNTKINISKITIGGFANIKETFFNLSQINALIAPNNYGKSNLLEALYFGIAFIGASPKYKLTMMKSRHCIPINKANDHSPFLFLIEGDFLVDKESNSFIYSYSFEWAKTDNPISGSQIISESLKIKNAGEAKYKSYINRDIDSTCYLASETGRCSKVLAVSGDTLALNKLINFDELFYVEKLKIISALDVRVIDTLENPDSYFSRVTPNNDSNDDSSAFPNQSRVAVFINDLKENHKERYDLLKNTIIDLLPTIEDFEPIKIDLRDDNEKMNAPFVLPDYFYDIKVKEKDNNQYTSISSISSGCKKILFVLSLTLAADLHHIPMITFEELENSVHPRLLQNLLVALASLAGKSKILFTSHSPYLLRYLSPEQINIGVPSKHSLACFKQIKPSKIKKLIKLASEEEASLGEYAFDMMLDADSDDERINEYFE